MKWSAAVLALLLAQGAQAEPCWHFCVCSWAGCTFDAVCGRGYEFCEDLGYCGDPPDYFQHTVYADGQCPKPPPSPVALNGADGGGVEYADPVKIRHLSSPDADPWNWVVGIPWTATYDPAGGRQPITSPIGITIYQDGVGIRSFALYGRPSSPQVVTYTLGGETVLEIVWLDGVLGVRRPGGPLCCRQDKDECDLGSYHVIKRTVPVYSLEDLADFKASLRAQVSAEVNFEVGTAPLDAVEARSKSWGQLKVIYR